VDGQLMQRAVAEGKVVLGSDGLAFSLFFGGNAQIQGHGHDTFLTPAAPKSKSIPDSLAQFSPQLRRSSPGNENYSKAVSIDLRFGGGGVMNRHAHEGRRNENP
jgi:hypothetical protein